MKFVFVIATTKKRTEKLPIRDFLSEVDFPDWTWVESDIEYENKEGLSKVYNKAIEKHKDADFICFVHDDWFCNDFKFFDKVYESKFDVIGVVGGLQYCVPHDWKERPFLWTAACGGKASGFVQHVLPDGRFFPSSYGPAPSPVVWLDGQCLIMNKKAIEAGLRFDEQFTFDFYDGSLCFDARKLGLSVGTAPILATHQSMGQGMMGHKEAYLDAQRRFVEKYFKKSAETT